MVAVTGLAEVEAQAAVLRGVVAGVAVDAVPAGEAPDMWRAFDQIARFAGAAKVLARRVEESGVWRAEGCRSAAEYLGRVSGGSVRGAREALRTSSQLAEAPVVEQALRAGRLSVPQAERIADAAAVDPAAQDRLVDAAGRLSLAELGQECGRVKAAADPDPDATHRRIREGRRLRQHTDGEGAWCFAGRGTQEDGALFRTALEPLIDQIYDRARREGRREHRDAYAYDALMELARQATATGGTGGGDTGDADGRDAGSSDQPQPRAKRRRSRSNPRYLALVRLDLPALVRGKAEPGELCEISGIGPVPVAVARELLGDAIVKLILTKGVSVANVTHLGRGPTVAQRMALLWQSPTCANEACASSFVQIDHREPWAATHRTRLDALDPLCPHCHRLKTHDGWALVDGTGKRAFVPPTDPRHPSTPKPGAADAA